MLLAASCLNLLVWSWNMAPAAWYLKYAGMNFTHISSFHPVTTPIWWFAASGVIENWVLFSVLVLVLAAGIFRKGGLWTTPQPWGGPTVSDTTPPIKYIAPQQQPEQQQVNPAGVPDIVPGGDAAPPNQTLGVNYVVSPDVLAGLPPEVRQQVMEHGNPSRGEVQ